MNEAACRPLTCIILSEVYHAAVPIRTLKYLAYHFLCMLLLETDRYVHLHLNSEIIIIIIIIIIYLNWVFTRWQ
jgi:hypothetical protein